VRAATSPADRRTGLGQCLGDRKTVAGIIRHAGHECAPSREIDLEHAGMMGWPDHAGEARGHAGTAAPAVARAAGRRPTVRRAQVGGGPAAWRGAAEAGMFPRVSSESLSRITSPVPPAETRPEQLLEQAPGQLLEQLPEQLPAPIGPGPSFARGLWRIAAADVSSGNRVQLLRDGVATFAAMLELIDGARESV